jgi:hypothetical protein
MITSAVPSVVALSLLIGCATARAPSPPRPLAATFQPIPADGLLAPDVVYGRAQSPAPKSGDAFKNEIFSFAARRGQKLTIVVQTDTNEYFDVKVGKSYGKEGFGEVINGTTTNEGIVRFEYTVPFDNTVDICLHPPYRTPAFNVTVQVSQATDAEMLWTANEVEYQEKQGGYYDLGPSRKHIPAGMVMKGDPAVTMNQPDLDARIREATAAAAKLGLKLMKQKRGTVSVGGDFEQFTSGTLGEGKKYLVYVVGAKDVVVTTDFDQGLRNARHRGRRGQQREPILHLVHHAVILAPTEGAR